MTPTPIWMPPKATFSVSVLSREFACGVNFRQARDDPRQRSGANLSPSRPLASPESPTATLPYSRFMPSPFFPLLFWSFFSFILIPISFSLSFVSILLIRFKSHSAERKEFKSRTNGQFSKENALVSLSWWLSFFGSFWLTHRMEIIKIFFNDQNDWNIFFYLKGEKQIIKQPYERVLQFFCQS